MKFSYTLIKKLFPEVPAKQKLVDALNMRSFETENADGDSIEISLPANRYADAASHIGIAREAAAALSLKFKNPIKEKMSRSVKRGLTSVHVEDPDLCPRYATRCFEINHVGTSSSWMQKVLKTCGLKPINNIVDVMNYVMLETGQPLHAFDYDKIAGDAPKSVIVRKAKKNEKIETLDGQKFNLDENVLVVADKEKPLAIAGIKGGASSGVSADTKRIIVEAANFNPVSVYKSAKRLKLQTDASMRFGHGISPVLVDWGLDSATDLLVGEGAKQTDSSDTYPHKATDTVIEFYPEKYSGLIGVAADAQKTKRYFTDLGFGVEVGKKRKNSLLVRVPAWRADISAEEDLMEEIARFEGYNELPPAPPTVSIVPAHEDDLVILKDRVRNTLLNSQLDEVYNSSFLGYRDLNAHRDFIFAGDNKFDAEKSTVEVENPIAEDKKFLRPSLLPLLIKNIKDNARFFGEIRIFETGKTFYRAKDGTRERLSLGIALASKKNLKLVLEMKGLADEFIKALGIGDFSIVVSGEYLRVEVGRDVLGVIASVYLEKGWIAALAEFDLEKILSFTEESREFVPLKKFPAILRDISVLAGSDTRIGELLEVIQSASPKFIENVDLFDEYVDERADSARGGGKQSLTFRIIFRSEERTLTDMEVNKELEKVAAALKKKFMIEVR